MITQDAKISIRRWGVDEICGIRSREVDCKFTGSWENWKECLVNYLTYVSPSNLFTQELIDAEISYKIQRRDSNTARL